MAERIRNFFRFNILPVLPYLRKKNRGTAVNLCILILFLFAMNTAQIVHEASKIIEADGGKTDDIAVVSSSYHLYRAKAIARSIGLQAAGVCGNPGYPVYMLGMFIREAFGVTHLWILGD